MPIELTAKKTQRSRPVIVVAAGKSGGLDDVARRWATENGFDGQAGRVLIVPGADGRAAGALLGTGQAEAAEAALLSGSLARELPDGNWHFAEPGAGDDLAMSAAGLLLGDYQFTRYCTGQARKIRFCIPAVAARKEASRVAEAVCLTRDLINTPASDMDRMPWKRKSESLPAK